MNLDVERLHKENLSIPAWTLLSYFVMQIEEQGYAIKPEDESWWNALDELTMKGICKVHGRNIRIDPKLVMKDEL